MSTPLIARLFAAMVTFSQGNLHDITHFTKVWGLARTIGELERLDHDVQLVLEAAAIVHDIACPLCRAKYGHADGHLQETEGGPLATQFLQGSGLSDSQIARVAFLVGHHHTLHDIQGRDHQILVEADYLVNAEESHYPPKNLANARDRLFRTESGTALLQSMFLR